MERLKIKKITLEALILFVVVAQATLSLPLPIHAQAPAQSSDLEYTLLAPLPGISSNNCDTESEVDCKTTLEKYLPGMFQLLIGLAAAFAVFMIVIGGFQYMTTDAVQGKSEGKERIKNAIFGLVLVIGAWLILYTINPDLLKLRLSIDAVNIQPPAGTSGTLGTGALQKVTQDSYDELVKQCTGCTLRITSTTGGTHTPGSDHYTGLAMDIAANTPLTQYLTGSTNPPAPCGKIDKILNGKKTTFMWEPKGVKCGQVASDGDHWHMSVTP